MCVCGCVHIYMRVRPNGVAPILARRGWLPPTGDCSGLHVGFCTIKRLVANDRSELTLVEQNGVI